VTKPGKAVRGYAAFCDDLQWNIAGKKDCVRLKEIAQGWK
jgi:hypothetical protein